MCEKTGGELVMLMSERVLEKAGEVDAPLLIGRECVLRG